MDKDFVTGFSRSGRDALRAERNAWVTAKGKALQVAEEAIVQEVRYWQQGGNPWQTNPTKTQRRRSFQYWDAKCAVCSEKISSLNEATFHHLKRGIPELHAPENMQPLHRSEEKGCHEKLHGAPPGSLTAGSRRKR